MQSTRRVGRISLLSLLALVTGCGTSVAFDPHRVVFIGDSITYLWPTAGQQQTFTRNDWVDKGVSGQTSSQIAKRFEADVIDQKPGTVHILAGTNDVYPGWQLCVAPPGAATLTEPPTSASTGHPADTCSNLEYMVATAKRHHIRVVLGSIPPWGPGSSAAQADASQARYTRIAQLNGWLRQFAAQQGVPLVDYHTLLQDASGEEYASGLTEDGVHPTAAGFARMTPAAEAAVSPAQLAP